MYVYVCLNMKKLNLFVLTKTYICPLVYINRWIKKLAASGENYLFMWNICMKTGDNIDQTSVFKEY